MKLFRRGKQTARPLATPSFGAWVLRQVALGNDTRELPFNRVEQLCSNAASLVCGAVHADPEPFRDRVVIDPTTQREAALVARRTADGFKASLADRQNAILSWPWDHIATRAAWLGAQASHLSEEDLGREIDRIGITYALVHREQLSAVIGLWGQVVAAIANTGEPPDLDFMGSEMFRAFRQVAA